MGFNKGSNCIVSEKAKIGDNVTISIIVLSVNIGWISALTAGHISIH